MTVYERILATVMKNILLVMTGGTIASIKDQDSIYPERDNKPLVLDMFCDRFGDYGVSFDVVMPYIELSENLDTKHFKLLYDTVKTHNSDKYDGIIVTCGTDTLDYTSAVCALTLSHLEKCVAVVSSDKVLSEKDANGMSNFKNAVDFIKEGKYNGAYTFYTQNGCENVHIASRITPCLNFTDTVESVDGDTFGVMQNGAFVKKSAVVPVCDNRWGACDFCFSDNILFIKGHPSVNPQFYDFKTQKPDCVVYTLYHSSTASVKGEKSAIALLEKCKKYGVDFYITPYRTRKDRYVTDEMLILAGAKPLIDMTQTVSLIKVMLAYGTFCDEKEREEFLNGNVFIEKVTQL